MPSLQTPTASKLSPCRNNNRDPLCCKLPRFWPHPTGSSITNLHINTNHSNNK